MASRSPNLRSSQAPDPSDSRTTWNEVLPDPAGGSVDLREVLGRRPEPAPAEAADLVCADQVARWQGGERVPAEAYLALAPGLAGDPDAAFELIYSEFVLRESLGERPTPDEFAWRFPRFVGRLLRQVAVHRAAGRGGRRDGPRRRGRADNGGAAGSGPSVPGYAILGELGRGGMGVVYKARHERLNRLVALKVIRADPSALARFRDEAEAVARFQHAHIIGVYEIGECDGLAYLALEYAAGGSLQAIFAGRPQDPARSAALVEDLARAIHHAHERGIIHRDLKPANIVLTEDGVPKVTDFGLAKLMERDEAATLSGVILGTPSYMAPEQLLGGSGRISPAVDVYALGAILYEALAGRPPFHGATPMSTLEQVASQDPMPPGRLQRHIPRDLETICLKCLEKDPARRYAGALELADDLRRLREGRPILARRACPWEVARKWARRRPVAASLLASLALAVASLVAGSLYYQEQLRRAPRLRRQGGEVGRGERPEDHGAEEPRPLGLQSDGLRGAGEAGGRPGDAGSCGGGCSTRRSRAWTRSPGAPRGKPRTWPARSPTSGSARSTATSAGPTRPAASSSRPSGSPPGSRPSIPATWPPVSAWRGRGSAWGRSTWPRSSPAGRRAGSAAPWTRPRRSPPPSRPARAPAAPCSRPISASAGPTGSPANTPRPTSGSARPQSSPRAGRARRRTTPRSPPCSPGATASSPISASSPATPPPP